MGLAQSFKFNYNNISEIENILKELNKKQINFEFEIKDYGLYTHRSGDYFEVLGLQLEKLTERFGIIEVNDL